ncbi:MAG: carboxypeptidase-like regulatory domain-containing protein [Balneolaceae bacterium]|nr:carboxypeptidase-like regulatory domain-containing protein [Balneolaceae bacterium]
MSLFSGRSGITVLSIAILFISAMPALSQNQKYAVTGAVTDHRSGQPLKGANVYLAGTTLGSSTDADGRYFIRNITQGVFELAFSYVGYEPVIKKLVITQSDDTLHIDASLRPRSSSLEEMTIKSERPARWIHLKERFTEIFLGHTSNARECKILNPEQLEFELTDDNLLIARAPNPLIVDNRALGYRIYIELEQFEWNSSLDIGTMVIYPKFELMRTTERRLRKSWERNRKKTYEGSLKHFLATLYEARSNYAGYEFNEGLINEISDAEKEFELAVKKDLPRELKKLLKGFTLPKEVQIKYSKYSQNASFYSSNQSYKVSFLAPVRNDNVFFVDPWGNLLEPKSIQLGGEWAANRVADLLPFHYGGKR